MEIKKLESKLHCVAKRDGNEKYNFLIKEEALLCWSFLDKNVYTYWEESFYETIK